MTFQVKNTAFSYKTCKTAGIYRNLVSDFSDRRGCLTETYDGEFVLYALCFLQFPAWIFMAPVDKTINKGFGFINKSFVFINKSTVFINKTFIFRTNHLEYSFSA